MDSILTQSDDAQAAEEQRNYYRLANLIVELGTAVIRWVILEKLKKCQTLQSLLDNEKIKSQLQQRLNERLISERQWKILYPETGDGGVELMKIDITLWIVLMKILIPKNRQNYRQRFNSSQKQFDWINDVYDLRDIRNELFHLPKPELDNDTFNYLWRKATGAISNLDHRIIDFDFYRNQEIDPRRLSSLKQLISEQVLQESNSHLQREIDYLRFLMKCIVATLISLLIILLLVYFVLKDRSCLNSRYANSTDLGSVEFIPRDGWGAKSPTGAMPLLNKPAKRVIYIHTATTAACQYADECCALVKHIQKYVQEDMKRPDITYHYLIDPRGMIYEGRSLDYVPGVADGFNQDSISIALFGNFMYESYLPGPMIGAFVVLMDWLKTNRFLIEQYGLYAHCEFKTTLSPGLNLYNYVNERNATLFHHVKHRNGSFCKF